MGGAVWVPDVVFIIIQYGRILCRIHYANSTVFDLVFVGGRLSIVRYQFGRRGLSGACMRRLQAQHKKYGW